MENTENTKKKNPLIFVMLGIAIIIAFFGIKSLLHNMKVESTDNAQIESRSVPVISRVAGYIDSLGVDDYELVKQGQLLIHIDDQEYKISLSQAQADLMSVQADLTNAQATYKNSIANKKVAGANAAVQQTRLSKAHIDLLRDEALQKEGAVTQKQVDDSRSTFESAQKQYTANEEQVNLASTQVAIAEAQIQKFKALIETRRASVEQAQLKLSYCKIVAPITGKIGRRGVEKGQLIQAGAPLFSVVNVEKYWVIANFKETQLENMKVGQEVSIVLDGYPDKEVKGKVTSFSQATGSKFALLPADNASGNFVKITQRVPVKIEILNAEKYIEILRAGLSVEVEVSVK